MADRLDFSDTTAVRAWLVALRVAFDDADAVTRDALRPLGRRELGRVLHRTHYRDARERIVSLLTYAVSSVVPPKSEPEGGPEGICRSSGWMDHSGGHPACLGRKMKKSAPE